MGLAQSAAVAAGLAWLAGCAAQDCDPNRADLFSGIGCSVGSGYGDRTRGLQGQYQAATSNANQQSLTAIEAQQAAANSQGELEQREAELASLDARTRSLRARLDDARRHHRLSEARLQAAEASLASLGQQRRQTGATSSQADIAALKIRQQKVADILSHM